MKRILAVASGKGGVGKTWFSISLSHAFARMKKRVLLVDCDIGLANIDVQLGLAKGPDLAMVALGRASASKAIKPVERYGFDVFPGRSAHGRPAGLDAFIVSWLCKTLDDLQDDYDITVLDLPSGIEQGVRDMMRYASQEIVMTTGEPTALADAYALIKATRNERLEGIPGIVVNFAQQASSGQQTMDGLIRVCDRFLAIAPTDFGVIRQDKSVPESIGRQTSLLACHPNSDAAQDVTGVAKVIINSIARP